MVAVEWTAADLQAWEEEQKKKKEEEEAKKKAEEEAALLGTTAPVYGNPQLAPLQPYTPPVATGLTSAASAAPATVAPPPPAPVATEATSTASAALPEQGGTYQSQGTPTDAKPIDMEQVIYSQRQEPQIGSAVTATNWKTGKEENIQPEPKKGGGLLSVVGDAANAVGNAVGSIPLAPFLSAVPELNAARGIANLAIPGKDVNTVGDAAKTGYEAYAGDIPVVSPFMRDVVKPAAGQVGEFLGAQAYDTATRTLPFVPRELQPVNLASNVLGIDPRGAAGDVGRVAAESLTPVSAGDIALSLLLPATADWADVARIAKSTGLLDELGAATARNAPQVQQIATRLGMSVDEAIPALREAFQLPGGSKGLFSGVGGTSNEAKAAREAMSNLDTVTKQAESAMSAFPRIAGESDLEYAVRLRTSGLGPDQIKAIETANAQKVGQAIETDAKNLSEMFQKVGHDTKQVRQRATRISDMMDRMKAAADDETGAVTLPGRTPTPPANVQKPLMDVATGEVPAEFVQKVTKPGGFMQTVVDESLGLAGAPLALKTTISPALLRQGMVRLITNPKAALQETFDSVRVALKETDARAFQQSLLDHPWSSPVSSKGIVSPFKGFTAGDVDLKIRDWGVDAPSEMRAPEFQGLGKSKVSQAVQAAPWVRYSDRQYAIEFNAHALNRYGEVASRMWDAGERNKQAYEELARIIEHQAHYGSWQQGKLPVFFSTRAMSGRVQAMTDIFRLNPLDALKPGAAQEAWKGAIAMVGGNLAVMYAVAEALPGFSVETYSLPPKLKTPVGTIDPWAGWGTIARAVYDTGTLIEKDIGDGSLDDLGPDVADRVTRFLRGQLGPVPSKVADIASGKDYKGDAYSLTKDVMGGGIITDMVAPMIAESIIEGYKNYGAVGAAVATGIEGLSGSINQSINDYDRTDKVAQESFGMDYFDLPPYAQAQVNVKLESQGVKVADKTRAGPYIYASNGALEVVQKRLAGDAEFQAQAIAFLAGLGLEKFDLSKYETIGPAHVAFVEAARKAGATRKQAEGAWADYTKGLGIDKITRQMREEAIREDPGIVDAVSAIYEEGEDDKANAPADWAEKLAAEVRAGK